MDERILVRLTSQRDHACGRPAPECDLDHAGTPSAFVAVVRLLDRSVEHLVLGDAIVALDTDDGSR